MKNILNVLFLLVRSAFSDSLLSEIWFNLNFLNVLIHFLSDSRLSVNCMTLLMLFLNNFNFFHDLITVLLINEWCEIMNTVQAMSFFVLKIKKLSEFIMTIWNYSWLIHAAWKSLLLSYQNDWSIKYILKESWKY